MFVNICMTRRIAVPVTANSMSKARGKISEINQFARDTSEVEYCAELRTDSFQERPDVPKLLEYPEVPVIVTNRAIDEGGCKDAWYGSDEQKRVDFLTEAARTGADYVDFEFRRFNVSTSAFGELREELEGSGTKLILSYHNFERTPDGLYTALFDGMERLNPDIVKIATKAQNQSDVEWMNTLIGYANDKNQPIIGICMGSLGEETRTNPGNYLMYAPLRKDEANAPGQLAAPELLEAWSE